MLLFIFFEFQLLIPIPQLNNFNHYEQYILIFNPATTKHGYVLKGFRSIQFKSRQVLQNMIYRSTQPHCVKSVRIRSYSGLYFPAFGLNTKRHSVSLRIQSECGKTRTRITPNTYTVYAVSSILLRLICTEK